MKNKVSLFCLIILFISQLSSAQIQFIDIGTGIGFGSIKGNTTAVDALTANASIDFKLWFSEEVTFRISYAHARMIEYLIPENRQNKYYPFLNIYSLTGNINQQIHKNIFLEESAGLIYVNDRTFNDVNSWEAGATFSLLGGIDFRNQNLIGFTLGLGYNFGITITKTSVSFSFITIQAKYYY